MQVEVWLYGPLARYGGKARRSGYACLHLELPAGARMKELLERLGIPEEEKGITFVNGQLTDLPGLGADLERELADGDRVGLFHTRSMWPFQYRFGAAMSPELQEALERRGGLHHSYARLARRGQGGSP